MSHLQCHRLNSRRAQRKICSAR